MIAKFTYGQHLEKRSRHALSKEQVHVLSGDRTTFTMTRREFDDKISHAGPTKYFHEMISCAEEEDVHVQEYAELLIADAISLRNLGAHRWTPWGRRIYKVQNSRMYRRVMRLIVVIHMFLTFFEPPSLVRMHDRPAWVTVAEGAILTLYLIDFIAHWASAKLYWENYLTSESVFSQLGGGRDALAIKPPTPSQRSLNERLQFGWMRKTVERVQEWLPFLQPRLTYNWVLLSKSVLVFLLLLGMAISNLSFARPLRGFLLIIHSQRLQSVSWAVIKTLPSIADIVFLIFVILLFFAIVGLYLLGTLYEPEDNYNFRDIYHSMLTFYVLMTTENYPDVMHSAWETNINYSVVFVTFLCIVYFVMLPLLTAVVFESYSKQKSEISGNSFILERLALTEAFRALTYDHEIGACVPSITRQKWADAKSVLQRAGGKKKLTDSLMDVWFEKLDSNNDGTISLSEFFELCEAILWKEQKAMIDEQPVDWFTEMVHKLRVALRLNHKWFSNTVQGKWFARFAIFVTVVNITALAYYHQDASAYDRAVIDTVDLVCLSFFVLEALLKIIVMGKSYFKDGWLQIDFAIVLLSIFAELLQSTLPGSIGKQVGQPLESVKAIRALRVFESSNRFRVLLSSVWDGIRGGLVQLAALIFTIVFMFAVVGMELFGDVNFSKEVPMSTDTSYEPVMLEPFQRFNTFTAALLTCFQVATTSDWHELMYETINRTNTSAAWYFVIMFFLLAIVASNIMGGLVWITYSSTMNLEYYSDKEGKNFDEEETVVSSRHHRQRSEEESSVRSRGAKKQQKSLKRKSAERWAGRRDSAAVGRLRMWDETTGLPTIADGSISADGPILRRLDSANMRIYREADPNDAVVRHTTFIASVIVHRKYESFLAINELSGDGWYLPSGPTISLENVSTAAVRIVKQEAGVDVTIKGIMLIEYAPVIPLYGHNLEARIRVTYVAEPKPSFLSPDSKRIPNAQWLKMKDIEDLERKHMTRGPELLRAAQHIASRLQIYPVDIIQTDLSGLTNPPTLINQEPMYGSDHSKGEQQADFHTGADDGRESASEEDYEEAALRQMGVNDDTDDDCETPLRDGLSGAGDEGASFGGSPSDGDVGDVELLGFQADTVESPIIQSRQPFFIPAAPTPQPTAQPAPSHDESPADMTVDEPILRVPSGHHRAARAHHRARSYTDSEVDARSGSSSTNSSSHVFAELEESDSELHKQRYLRKSVVGVSISKGNSPPISRTPSRETSKTQLRTDKSRDSEDGLDVHLNPASASSRSSRDLSAKKGGRKLERSHSRNSMDGSTHRALPRANSHRSIDATSTRPLQRMNSRHSVGSDRHSVDTPKEGAPPLSRPSSKLHMLFPAAEK